MRSRTDKTAVSKYDGTRDADMRIAKRVYETAQARGCSMSQVALAWLWAKGVASPIVGATKSRYLSDAAGALDIRLSAEEIAALEADYLPHKVVGAL